MALSSRYYVSFRFSFDAFVTLSLFLFFSGTTTGACTVTSSDGTDVTKDFFTEKVVEGVDESYVDCAGNSKCRDFIIENCPSVKCADNEACASTKIHNVSRSVVCDGLHSCHRTEIKASRTTESVSCLGTEACDVAQVFGYAVDEDGNDAAAKKNEEENEQRAMFEIRCEGKKACRKIHAENIDLVKCRDGSESHEACHSLATFNGVGCMYCGKGGCADHINQCRYKPLPNIDSEEYQICVPESITGDEQKCPVELQEELSLELSGLIEEGKKEVP